MEEIPIIEGVSIPPPQMSISKNIQPHILEICLDDDIEEILNPRERFIHIEEGKVKQKDGDLMMHANK